MALIKNAYSPGQWYAFFYEAKNVEQSSYYNNLEKQFSSWYSFLQKDQIQGKIYDFLGVPNICGKINKKQLQKIYANENSNHNRFEKLDVQVKRIKLNDTHQSSTSTKSNKFFKSKNARHSDKNTILGKSITRIGLQKVDERRTIEEKSRFSKTDSKSQRQLLLNFSRQTNGNNSDDSCNNSDDVLNQSDEDIFVEFNSKFPKEPKTIAVPKTPINNETLNSCNNSDDVLNQSDEDIFVEINSKSKKLKAIPVSKTPVNKATKQECSVVTKTPHWKGDGETPKKSESSVPQAPYIGVVPEIMGLKQPSSASMSFSKKKVEFKKENEYFFFKEINSSTTHSSHSDVAAESKRLKFSKPSDFSDNSSNEDGNAFDTGFLSPVQDFCSASPVQQRRMGSSYEPAAFGITDNISNSSSAIEGDDSSNGGDNVFDTGFLTPVQGFCLKSPQKSQNRVSPHEAATTGTSSNIRNASSLMIEELDSSDDHDNDFDTGFLSPVQDFCSASPLQTQEIASQYATTGSGNIRNASSLMIDNPNDRSSDDDNTTSPRTRNANKRENTSNESSQAIEREPATTHGMVLPRSQSEREFSVDRRISRALSVKSTDDEILSQTSAMTEVFATSILVDLRMPGALHAINDEYKRIFDTLSSQNPFPGRAGGPSHVFDIATTDKGFSRFGNVRDKVPISNIQDNSHINLIGRNTIVHGRRHMLQLTENLTQDSITINSQEELTKIRKVNLNSIENDSIMRSIEQNLEDEMSKIVERVSVSSDPLEISLSCDTGGPQRLDSDAQHDSMLVNPNSLEHVDKSAENSNKRTIIKELNSTDNKAEKLSIAPPTPKIEKRATPLGRKRLPLKKRSLLATPISSPRGFAEGNEGLPASIIDKVRFADIACSAAVHKSNSANPSTDNETKDIADEGCKPVTRDNSYRMSLETMKTKKQHVDLAWKLSLPHISGLFFNDPDVSTKFREGSLSFSTSHGPSSKSTHPRKQLNEEFRVGSDLNSSIAHEFEDMDLNPPEQEDEASVVKFLVEDAVTPNVSLLGTNDFTGSPSPQSENQSESEIALNSPFVKDILVHTQSFLASENARVLDIYDMETPGKSALDPSKSGNDVSPLLKNFKRESPEQILPCPNTDYHSVKSSVANSDTNFQVESVESIRFSAPSSPSAIISWWNKENITPMRKSLPESSSSVSDDSLRVRPPTSQRKVKDLQRPPMIPVENIAHRDFSISSRNSDMDSRRDGANKAFACSNKGRANFGSMAGAKWREDIDEMGETGHLKPEVVSSEGTAQGKRMSTVISNVIMKPVGAERQSNEHDFLICEDENPSTFSLSQEE